MKTFTHKTFKQLEEAAQARQTDILDSGIAFYFRIFVDRRCTEMHIYYKK